MKKIEYKIALERGIKKVCTKCSKELTIDKFNKDKNGKYGVKSICRECQKEYDKQRISKISYIQAKNRGLKKLCSKCGRKLPVDCFHQSKFGKYGAMERCKDCKKDIRKNHYEKNKEKEKEQQKEYYERNKEDINKKHKKYRGTEQGRQMRIKYLQSEAGKQAKKRFDQSEKGKQGHRRAKSNRKANKNNVFSYTYDLNEIQNYFPSCAYTGEKFIKDMSLEHVIAIVKGGSNAPWNLIYCNTKSNSSKCDRDLLEWYITKEYFSLERLQYIIQYIAINVVKYYEVIPKDDLIWELLNKYVEFLNNYRNKVVC